MCCVLCAVCCERCAVHYMLTPLSLLQVHALEGYQEELHELVIGEQEEDNGEEEEEEEGEEGDSDSDNDIAAPPPPPAPSRQPEPSPRERLHVNSRFRNALVCVCGMHVAAVCYVLCAMPCFPRSSALCSVL